MPRPSEHQSLASESESQARGWVLNLVIGAILAGLLATVIWFQRKSPVSNETLARAETACLAGDFRTAQQLAREVLQQHPENFRARLVAAKCLHAQNRSRQAVALLAEIPADQPPHSVEAACLAGDIQFLKLYRPSEAEALYRQALRDDPASVEANDRLAILLTVTGDWWRQIPFRLASVRGKRFNRLDLFVMALAENALANPELAEVMGRVSPNDPLVLLAASRLAVEDEDHDEAIRLLVRAVELAPDLIQAHVLLGTEFFHLGDEVRIDTWVRHLPPSANDHPGIWALRGKWAQRRGHREVAVRCFCEAVQRDPNHADAMYQAGRVLESLQRSKAAVPFFERVARLQDYINATKAVDTDDALVETERAAKLAESLGNYWEAWGWASIAAAHPQGSESSRQTAARLALMLPALPFQRTRPDENPASTFDYRSFPLLEAIDVDPATGTSKSQSASTEAYAFRDRADSAGITFQYVNGSRDVASGTRHMFEVMGGGVAVLDVNSDDFPDLYFAQGGSWPARESNREFLDRLYLSTGSGEFVDVTEPSGIVENRFSQGVTVGDFDSDGFDDILVANIGRNRLYRSNGDGTYRDISRHAGFDRSDWTTSCAIADVTADGHPELYVVNYLGGDDVFTRLCGAQNNNVCLPQHFPHAVDRLFWNPGDEGFQDVTASCGIEVDNGKGLGIIVGAFGDTPGLNIFVGNDTVANFYFENLGNAEDGAPRFQENALVSGLALSGAGTAQACMGIAAGYADSDSGIDLFVTNFHGESNTLYRQTGDGFFEDVALKRKLRQPSLSKLGFGTQFLDADLDGRLDVVVANGHIDNFSQDGRIEYEMRPQFFANLGPAGFREVDADMLGPYFGRKVLGRSLARLDWNADGREDFVVTHLDAPAALLENDSKQTGNYIVFRLCGVESSRDAIGTVVHVETGRATLTRQLTAGDGFLASNERILTFGLGDDATIDRLTVSWPSGRTDEFSKVPANTDWILIEGRQSPFPSPSE